MIFSRSIFSLSFIVRVHILWWILFMLLLRLQFQRLPCAICQLPMVAAAAKLTMDRQYTFLKTFFSFNVFTWFKPLSCLTKWNRRSWPLCIRLFNNHFFIIVKFVLCRYFHCFNGHPLSNLISDVIWIQTIKKQQKKIFLNGFYKEVTQ